MAKKVSKTKSAKEAPKVSKTPSKKAETAAKAAPIEEVEEVEAPKKYKNPLTKKELQEFRQMLLDKRRDLIGDLNGIEAAALKNRQGGSGDLSNMPTHLADLGTDNFEQEFTLGLLESERILLREINEALERISDGAYGMCLGTGKPIPKPRLRARPWSKYCIEYARMLEKGLVRAPIEGESPQQFDIEDVQDSDDEA